MSVVARVPVEDTKLFDEAMRVVHEVFTPRDLEDEVKRVIQRGIMTKPAVIAALAYFLCRSRNTQTYAPLPIAAGKFLASLEGWRRQKRSTRNSSGSICVWVARRM